VLDAGAAHAPFVKKLYTTVPVAVNPATPVTVAVSWNDAPVLTVPNGGLPVASSTTTVSVADGPGTTANGSHGLVDPP
jgi:hypothetical protein